MAGLLPLCPALRFVDAAATFTRGGWPTRHISCEILQIMRASLHTMRLLVVSHVPHSYWDGSYHAYGPYAREIEIWADLFSEVVIAAPCRNVEPAGDMYRIRNANVRVARQKEAGGEDLCSKIRLLFATPLMALGLAKNMATSDAIHVRCPGNLGLLGAILAPLFSKRLIAKYAGQWAGYPGEAWSFRAQRAILGSRWWRGPVTVYGEWPNQPRHVVSFFTSMLTAEQLSRGNAVARARQNRTPITIAYSGRLTKPKHVDVIIRAIALLKSEGAFAKALIMGDGPERESLQTLANHLAVADRTTFTGGISSEEVMGCLEQADVFALVSETEGWPKALTEAMAFGLVCIGSDRGLIPQFLADGRGVVVPAGDATAVAGVLREVIASPEKYQAMGRAASAWAKNYSLEGVQCALRELMVRSWKLSAPKDNNGRLSDLADVQAR